MASRPPFYGIWMVDEFTLGGKVLPPLWTDESHWQSGLSVSPNGWHSVHERLVDGILPTRGHGEEDLCYGKPTIPRKSSNLSFRTLIRSH